MMPEPSETVNPSSPPKNPSRMVSALVWLSVLAVTLLCCAWIIGRWVYWFDLAASHQMLIGWVSLVVFLLILISRRWRAGMVCGALICISFFPVLIGRTWSLQAIDITIKPSGTIRIVSCNLYPRNESWEQDLETLMSLNADVVVLLEVPIKMNQLIQYSGLLDSTPYATWTNRRWVERETSPCFILSKHPIEIIDTSEDLTNAKNKLFVKVKAPAGDLIVGLVHPLSPRSVSRWDQGNRVIESQAKTITSLLNRFDLPIALCADLNAGPAQIRARTLRTSGIRMSKPILNFDGSFPVHPSVPRVLRVQLDDVWTSPGITPIAWGMIETSGSDHQAVVVDLEFVGQ